MDMSPSSQLLKLMWINTKKITWYYSFLVFKYLILKYGTWEKKKESQDGQEDQDKIKCLVKKQSFTMFDEKIQFCQASV